MSSLTNFSFKATLGIFFQNSETTFSKQFCPNFLCFLCKSQGWNTKKVLKTEHQCTFFSIMNFTNFYPFFGIFLLCCIYSNIFTFFFRGSEVCLERGDSCGNFRYLKKKSNIFILREICKRTQCPPIGTLVCSSSYLISGPMS